MATAPHVAGMRMALRSFIAATLATAAVGCGHDEGPANPEDDVVAGDASDTVSTDVPMMSDTLSETADDVGITDAVTPGPDGAGDTVVPDVSADVSEVSEDTETPPTLPVEPALVAVIDETPWLWVGIVAPSVWLASDGENWFWSNGSTTDPVVTDESTAPTLPPADARPSMAVVGAGEVLIASSVGLGRIRDGVALGGPLVERFDSEVLTSIELESATPLTFWLSGANGLKRWSDGQLRPFTATGVSFDDNMLAWGAPFAPENDPNVAPPQPAPPALWLAGPHGVSALRTATNPPALGLERPDLAPPATTMLGVDRDGHLYASGEGVLHVRLPAAGRGRWIEAPLPAPVRTLATNRDAAVVWALLQDGRLVRGRGVDFAEVAPVPPVLAAATHMAVHADGRLLVATPVGLHEISASRTVTLPALPATPLTSTQFLTIRASDPDQIASVTAEVHQGGQVIATPTIEVRAEGRVVILNPLAIPNGNATLRVTIDWNDGDSASAEVAFRIAFPTWSNDVEPLYAGFCSNCHGPDNGGNFASLHIASAWSVRIDNILCRIDAHAAPGTEPPECETLGFDVASMPPGRTVPSDRVTMLRAWRDAGFRP